MSQKRKVAAPVEDTGASDAEVVRACHPDCAALSHTCLWLKHLQRWVAYAVVSNLVAMWFV